MLIGIDFDGTCVKHAYPQIGEDIGAVPVLKELIDNGHQLILITMRDKNRLTEALQWFIDNGILLTGVNANKSQKYWTSSPKIYCHLYIDDAGLGCPLLPDKDGRNYVDWIKVRSLLVEQGLLPK